MMTGTELLPSKVLGQRLAAALQQDVAETTFANIQKVGMPVWSDADQTLAKALQKELGSKEQGLVSKVLRSFRGRSRTTAAAAPTTSATSRGTCPTVTLRFPSNIPGLPGHNWANAISMATPIAHKGATAGAKVQAMTMLDLVLKPALVDQAWAYFRDVQTKTVKYEPLDPCGGYAGDRLEQGHDGQGTGRSCARYYYDPSRYKTYLEQLGITYPTVRQ